MKKVEWAYLAGLIDGEGCITSRRNSKGSYYTRMTISQKRVELLWWVHERFGGAVSVKGRTWHAGSRHSAWVLEGVLPYLVLKRDQAEVALALCERGTKGHRLPRVEQERLALRLKELKR